MQRLSPVKALKLQGTYFCVIGSVAVARTHWPSPASSLSILKGRQTRTSTTSSTVTNSRLNLTLTTISNLRPRYIELSRIIALSPIQTPGSLCRLGLSRAMASAFSAYHGPSATASQHTVTALGRWSVLNQPLPGSLPIGSIFQNYLTFLHGADLACCSC
jgi:hypothetical protein